MHSAPSHLNCTKQEWTVLDTAVPFRFSLLRIGTGFPHLRELAAVPTGMVTVTAKVPFLPLLESTWAFASACPGSRR